MRFNSVRLRMTGGAALAALIASLHILTPHPAWAVKASAKPSVGGGGVTSLTGNAGASLTGAAPLSLPQSGFSPAALPSVTAINSIPTSILADGLRQRLPEVAAAARQA